MTSTPGTEIVEHLDPVEPSERERLVRSLSEDGAHAAAMRSLAALHQVELGGQPPASTSGDTMRVVAWNLERGTNLDAALPVLAHHRPDVVLLSELDVGMARSGNRHTPAEIAEHLGHGYAYGIEFIELGLGDGSEVQRLGREAANDRGLHGNAITSRFPLTDPMLVRIEERGSWFDEDTDQPRVGGRMALAARLDLEGGAVVVGSVHLESNSDPALRAEQLAVVLDAIDARYGRGACVLGGDLNTFSASLTEAQARFRELREADPRRFCWPVPYEPLFEVAAGHGFDVDDANPAEQTMRLAVDQRPGSLVRLDWLLARGLEVTDRWTIPALGPDGAVISDHDAVAATVRLATSTTAG